jgi:hypothetical protein
MPDVSPFKVAAYDHSLSVMMTSGYPRARRVSEINGEQQPYFIVFSPKYPEHHLWHQQPDNVLAVIFILWL